MRVLFSERLSVRTIGLSTHLFPGLTFPDHLPYECQLQNTTLLLGPVIGMIVGRQGISDDTFEEFESYLAKYETIKGLIYLCAESGIHTARKTIEGYYYDPHETEDNKRWKQGVFPYPGAIYRRVLLKDSIYYDLARELRGRIFNSYLFNKFEMWNVLSREPSILPHLPDTAILKGSESLNHMLTKHKSVYLKPIYGGYGLGILKVDKNEEGFRFYNSLEVDKHTKSLVDLEDDLQQLVKGYYLVQQAVPLTYEDRQVDFRVILQKDKSKTWKSSGMVARFGRIERIYTNEVSGVAMGVEALQEIFSITEQEAIGIEHGITYLCIKASRLLEKQYAAYGEYGDLGIDVIVDQHQHIWLLEVNKFHEHDIGLYIDSDPELYERMVTTPLEYAKALAGFK